VKKFLIFYWIRRVHAMSIASCHWTLSLAVSIHKIYFNNILHSMLRFPKCFPLFASSCWNFVCTYQTMHICYTACPPHSPNLITIVSSKVSSHESVSELQGCATLIANSVTTTQTKKRNIMYRPLDVWLISFTLYTQQIEHTTCWLHLSI